MAITQSSDFAFVPQVASDHMSGYFNDSLVFGAFAFKDERLKADAKTGDEVTMPFYKTIGAAEEPTEMGILSVDKLQDDSFKAKVKEVGKAVGFTDKSIIVSGDSKQNTYEEATKQVGRVFAEKVDNDIITEINTVGNHIVGYSAAAIGDVCNVQNLLRGKVTAFGDKEQDAKVLFLHSQHIITFGVELFTKMLVKDPNDPYNSIQGFKGRMLDMAVIVTDKMPRLADIGGKRVYSAFAIKEMPYGMITKQDMQVEADRDILARQTIMAATQWYAVKSYHAKISALDLKTAKFGFATEQAA